MSNPKTINALMKYLRDKKGIKISGASDKRKLMNIGYYHGYKGYRYINKPYNQIKYTNFEELLAVYDFDMQLKALFYPYVMQIETALKNYVLEIIISEIKSESFTDIYSKILDNYKMFSPKKDKDKFKKEFKKLLDLRNRIYKIQTEAYSNNKKIVSHFINKNMQMPIWAIFELLTFGEFGHFVSCINQRCRKLISQKMGIPSGYDTSGIMPQRLIYTLKDLRNAIAHNDVVFDTRFKTNQIDNQISNVISNITGIKNLTFQTITDYVILIVYILKLIKSTKSDINRIIQKYTKIVENFRAKIPISPFNQIIYTDNNIKIQSLKIYIMK